MLTYDLIKKLCKQKGVTVTGTERELGFARGSLCKVNTSAPSMEKVRKLAEYFEVDIEYLMNNGEVSKQEQKLNARDERDIKKDLDSIINDGEAIEVKCQFCNKAYHFDVDELKEMRSAK